VTIARTTFAAALATLALGIAVPHASAAPIVVGTDYAERSMGSCPNKAECTVTFSAVPAGKSLVVTDVSCRGQIPVNKKLVSLQMTSAKPDGYYNYIDNVIEFNTPVPNGLYNAYQGHQQMRFVIFAGEKPIVTNLRADFVGENFLVCSIVGILK